MPDLPTPPPRVQFVLAPAAISATDAAVYLGISWRRVCHLIDARELHAVREGKSHVVTVASCDAWLHRRMAEAGHDVA